MTRPVTGARARIRTGGLRLRRPSLYPAELHAQKRKLDYSGTKSSCNPAFAIVIKLFAAIHFTYSLHDITREHSKTVRGDPWAANRLETIHNTPFFLKTLRISQGIKPAVYRPGELRSIQLTKRARHWTPDATEEGNGNEK